MAFRRAIRIGMRAVTERKRVKMNKFQILVCLLATASFGKSMLSSISVGMGSDIEYRGKSLDSKVILNGDARYNQIIE